MDQGVHQGQVGSGAESEVDVRVARDFSVAGIDADELRPVRAGQAVQNPRPQHRLRFSHVVTVEEDGVAAVDIFVRSRLPVGPEGLLQGRRRRGRAQAGVSVHVRGADAGLADDSESVVLLKEQLAAGVEAVAERSAVPAAMLVLRPTIRFIAVSQSHSTSFPLSRISGRVNRSRWTRPASWRRDPSDRAGRD